MAGSKHAKRPAVRRARRRIPTPADWEGYQNDPELRHARKLLMGQSVEDVRHLFEGGQRASELLNMPRRVFQYYVLAFAKYLILDRAVGDSDAASSFLRLLASRERRDIGSVAEIFGALRPYVEYVAAHQGSYAADPNVYGSFRDQAADIATQCSAKEDNAVTVAR